MALEKIKLMLQRSIGLHSRSIGDASIERAIRYRMSVLNIAGDNEYVAMLQREENEFNELVEEVVVPETWFFRNTSPFDALDSYIPQLTPASGDSPDTPLKILSLPCSTGEEPYSIAMVLMEKGLQGKGFSIDALDISQRAIDKAKRAIYGRNSFREAYRDLQNKYFEAKDSGFRLQQRVKEHVKFSRANIIEDNFENSNRQYDVIFCRNLLIYFDHKTQSEVLEKLHAMLKIGGIIFVGHAESAQLSPRLYQSLDIPMAFAFRAIDDSADVPPVGDFPEISSMAKQTNTLKDLQSTFRDLVNLTEKDQLLATRVAARRSTAAGLSTAIKPTRKAASIAKGASNPTDSQGRGGEKESESSFLEKISQLIEQGKLSLAGELAQSCRVAHPDSAEAHYYLGLICHFEGGSGAAESLLKKAIYLDPRHHAAMGLLSLIADSQGDAGQAQAYRRRQQRAIYQDSLIDDKNA